MNEEWQNFLEARGARLDEQGFARFDRRAAECALVDLSWLGLIRVAGKDAAGFLQGQLTNDTRLVDDIHSALGAYCTPKGRMLALFRMFRRNDALWLLLPAERLEATLGRLGMFVLMSQVELADASEAVSLAQAFSHPVETHKAKIEAIEATDFAPADEVRPGAVVVLEDRRFVVAVATTRFECEGETYMGISPQSPIYRAMQGLGAGDSFALNGREMVIQDVF